MNPLSPAARRGFFVYSSEYERFRWKLADNVRAALLPKAQLYYDRWCALQKA